LFFNENLKAIQLYYENQSKLVLEKMSDNYNYPKNESNLKNRSIDKVVENYYSNPFVVLDVEIQRRFMSAYFPPYYNQQSEIFLSSYISIMGQKLNNYTVGVIAILFFNLIMSIFVIFSRKPYV